MADTDPAVTPMDDQPGKLPEPKEAGMESEAGKGEAPVAAATNEE